MAADKCNKCGAALDAKSDTCPKCGAKKADRESNGQKAQYSEDAIRSFFMQSETKTEDNSNAFGSNELNTQSIEKATVSKSTDTAQSAPKRSTQSKKGRTGTTTKRSTKSAPIRTPIISAGKCIAAIVCCVPVILELLFILLIPQFDFLAGNAFISKLAWQELILPMKVSVLSVIILGFLIQLLGLFNKINKPLGMFTQIISFLLFVASVYAAQKNTASVYTLWGLAVLVPASLLVTALRYLSADGFGFIDDFNFWYYLPIALEVTEYIVFFLVFPLIFGVTSSLWFFVALTVTTVGSIAVSSFWEDMHWVPVGINLAVALLLCLIYWLGIIFSSEWMWNGGIIVVVILAIGASWFIHWFIHRNDDEPFRK